MDQKQISSSNDVFQLVGPNLGEEGESRLSTRPEIVLGKRKREKRGPLNESTITIDLDSSPSVSDWSGFEITQKRFKNIEVNSKLT